MLRGRVSFFSPCWTSSPLLSEETRLATFTYKRRFYSQDNSLPCPLSVFAPLEVDSQDGDTNRSLLSRTANASHFHLRLRLFTVNTQKLNVIYCSAIVPSQHSSRLADRRFLQAHCVVPLLLLCTLLVLGRMLKVVFRRSCVVIAVHRLLVWFVGRLLHGVVLA